MLIFIPSHLKAAPGGINSLMADLNKGSLVTKGLNKVTKDQKTKYRKPEERSSVVKAVPKKAPAKRFGGKYFYIFIQFIINTNKKIKNTTY